MLLLDVLIRYPTIALLLLTAFLCIRDGKRQPTIIYAALVSISIAAMLLSLSQPELELPLNALIALHIISIPNTVFIWWLGLSMFQESFIPKTAHWIIGLLSVSVGCIDRLLYFGVINIPAQKLFDLGDYLILIMMVHLAYVAISGRANDLVEPRRRLRLFFVMGLIGGTILIVSVEDLYYQGYAAEVTLFRALVIFPLTLWAVLWLTRFSPEKLLFQDSSNQNPKNVEMDPRDNLIKKELLLQMEEKKSYLDQNLTIRSLADLLGTPEHRLRSLINKGLGFRNFSDFLNSYRINEIKAAFAKEENSRVPVLTIALNTGYNSLAPFNRAFLKSEGVTPSQYRKKLVKATSQNSK